MKHAVENIKSKNVPDVVAENPLDKLNFRSEEFTNGVNELAKILNTVPHPDPLVTLRAVRKVIVKRMAPDCVENPEKYIVKVFIIFTGVKYVGCYLQRLSSSELFSTYFVKPTVR
nr:unnamed protein product [Callosobruchus chinensis]